MKSLLLSGMVCLTGVAAQAANLDIVADKNASYKVGEKVTFTATAWESAGKKLTSGKYTIQIKDSGIKTIGKPIVVDIAKNNPAIITTQLDRPGFILVSASPLKTADGKTTKWLNKPVAPLGGAAVEPEKIKPGLACPADFNEFWQKGLQEFKKAQIIVKPAPEVKYKGYKVSRLTVKFPDGSGLIDGFLSVPVKPGKYPIVAGVPGAGPGSVTPVPVYNPSKPAIRLWMNVHNYLTAKTAAEQKKLYAEFNKKCATKAYFKEKHTSRDTDVYRNIWLALSAALDYAAALPEFDGKHVAAVGSSQGGGTALALASLNSKVTCVVSNVPALCDHDGWRANRQAGWPKLHSALRGKADKTLPYFDGANFALNIKVPVLMSAGYIDTTCSPSSVYAAFNNLSGAKTMFPMFRVGHSGTKPFTQLATKFLNEQFKK